MFLTRQDIEDGLAVLEAFDNLKTEEQVKIVLAGKIAKSMFDDFDKMSAEEKADILNMLVEDMVLDFYAIN